MVLILLFGERISEFSFLESIKEILDFVPRVQCYYITVFQLCLCCNYGFINLKKYVTHTIYRFICGNLNCDVGGKSNFQSLIKEWKTNLVYLVKYYNISPQEIWRFENLSFIIDYYSCFLERYTLKNVKMEKRKEKN